jgi:hypothetical protein
MPASMPAMSANDDDGNVFGYILRRAENTAANHRTHSKATSGTRLSPADDFATALPE